MTESTNSFVRFLMSGWRAIQWVLTAFFTIIALVVALTTGDSLEAPGAPVASFWASVAVLAAVAISLSPPVFFRLPRLAKFAAYVAMLFAVIFASVISGQVTDAYHRTPEGAKAKADLAEAEAAEAELEAMEEDNERRRQSMEDMMAEAELIEERQQACLSWSGQVSELSETVEDSLHNPGSFEHVSTDFIIPGPDRYNVAMTFRAENGFGAVRTARVLAQMVPESCEIVSISEPEPL